MPSPSTINQSSLLGRADADQPDAVEAYLDYLTPGSLMPHEPHCVPHSAFDDSTCPPGVPPRASIEMRGTAYWCG